MIYPDDSPNLPLAPTGNGIVKNVVVHAQFLPLGLLFVAFLGGILYACTIESPPGWLCIVNYLALILFGSGLAFIAWIPLKARFPRYKQLTLAGLSAIPIGLVLWWAQYDWYLEHWTMDNGWKVTDTVRRFGRPFERIIYTYDADGKFGTMISGPLSPSGKMHGEWRAMFGMDGSTWYWYGEEVSEGTWHLRNNK